MNLLELIAGPIFKIIDKLIPDPAAKAQAQLDILKMQQAGEFKELEAQLQMALAQVEVNKIEAAAPDLFTRGWRPAVGWICALGLASTFLVRPYVIAFTSVQIPELDMGTLLTLLCGLLGLGTLRTVEKVKGTK
jgi:hypothetical protein